MSSRASIIPRCVCKAVLLATGLPWGCKSDHGVPANPPESPPAYQELASAHNKRIELLRTMYADGVIEIRWKDKNGNHYEQGNMELWLQLARRTALRVEKFSAVALWLGSDDERYWLFDKTNDQNILHVGRHEDRLSDESGAFVVKPLALLDLMALTALPDSGGSAPPVQYESKLDAWAIETRGGGGPMRIYFDRMTRRPKRVESLGDDGRVAAFSTLEKYESVSREGTSPLAFPKIAYRIQIQTTRSAGGNLASGEATLFIDHATGDVDPEQLSKVFDLNVLIKSMKPERIDGELLSQAASTSAR